MLAPKTFRCVVGLLVMLFPLISQAQCSMCRAVLESEADGGAAEAINDGIVYLMIFPYVLMGGIAYFIWRMMKKSAQKSTTA